jgi:hypothetical protein
LKNDSFLPLRKISVGYEGFLWVYLWNIVVIKKSIAHEQGLLKIPKGADHCPGGVQEYCTLHGAVKLFYDMR